MAGLLTATVDSVDAVAAELHRWAVEPFDLAQANCGLSVITYVGRVTGRDAPPWLDAIGRVGALRLMRSDRAFEAVATRALAEMGCGVTVSPERGDVALVDLPGTGLTACICTGLLWAARGDREAVLAPGTATKAWSVSCRRR